MTTETKADDIRLHHSIGREPVQDTAAGDDFAAAFNSDDDAPPVEQEPAQEPETPPQETVAEGVDTPETGEQGAPQEQQQPAEIALDGLPDDVRQRVQAILDEKQRLADEVAQRERDFVALHNRVAPVQRELDIAKRELAKRSAPAAQQPEPAAPVAQSAAAVMAQFETPEWKEYERLYPEDAALQKRNQLAIAKAMDEQVVRLKGEFESVTDRINRIEQERIEQQQRAELDVLSSEHPDWRQINESGEFWDWFGEREAMFGFRDDADKQNRLNNRQFVSGLLDMYKATNRPVSAPAPAQPQVGVPPQPASAALNLAASPRNAGTGIRRPAGAPSVGDEFLAGFNSD